MDSGLKKGLFLITIMGAVSFSGVKAKAADLDSTEMPGVGIEAILKDCDAKSKQLCVEDYLVPENKGEYLDMAFADVTSFLYIRSEPTIESEWVGKLYPGYAAHITGPAGEWTPIESGGVTGYVKTEYITLGMESEKVAKEQTQAAEAEGKEEPFTYAVSRQKEEEQTQLAREAAVSRGQEVVNYACQFIGNPYVWGGTSLTGGADCSGFVQSVFAHFGISLPRTSGEQRSAGTEVSYEEAVPGDLICYDGHVGIYTGNGEIVNARNPAQGIGMSPATYTTILSVRRVLY